MPLDSPTTPQGLGALDRPGFSLDEITPAQAASLLGETPEGTLPEGDPTLEAAEAEDEELEAASTEEGDAEESPEESAEATADEAESEWKLPESLPKLAEDLGVTTDDMANVRVTTKVNGETGETPISELVKSYQLQSHLTQQQQQFAEQRKAQEADLATHRQKLTEEYEKATQVSQMLLNEMLPAEPDAELRQTDPGEWAAQMQARREAEQKIAQLQGELGNRQKQQYQQVVADSQKQVQQLLHEGRQKLAEWDNSWGQEKATQLREWLVSEGFAANEVDEVVDWRVVRLAEMARKYATAQAPKEDLARKRVAKAPPKVMRPGPARRTEESKVASLNKTRQRLRKTGSLDDAYELLLGAKAIRE